MLTMLPSAPPPSYNFNSDTVLTLPEGAHSLAISDACRVTALAFLNESLRWGKAELAMWLMGPYGHLTQYGWPLARRREQDSGTVPLLREIDVGMVGRVIRSAHEEAISMIKRIGDPEGAATFAFTMLASGFVARCEDNGRNTGWVPTRSARRLADRVLSLLAADYLTRPLDYEKEVCICAQCSTVVFDAGARARGICSHHVDSMVVPHLRSVTLPYFPGSA